MAEAGPISSGILAAIGGTPLVRLSRLGERRDLRVWAKLESANPGGSAKDRSAVRLIQDAIDRGELRLGNTVVESTSGNLGVGLAQACRYLGLDLVCVVDSRAHSTNIRTMRAFGADVRIVDAAAAGTRDLLQARLDLVQDVLAERPGAFWPNQYENQSSVVAHRDGTMREIDNALDGQVDYLFVAASTTGTLRGCCEYINANRRDTRVIAVDAEGSALFGGEIGKRRLPGYGAGVVPKLSKGAWFDSLVRVGEVEAVVGCRRLVEREAVLAGASSGAVASAFASLEAELDADSTCALIFADGGTGYLDTVYSDEWVHGELAVAADELSRLVTGDPPAAPLPV